MIRVLILRFEPRDPVTIHLNPKGDDEFEPHTLLAWMAFSIDGNLQPETDVFRSEGGRLRLLLREEVVAHPRWQEAKPILMRKVRRRVRHMERGA